MLFGDYIRDLIAVPPCPVRNFLLKISGDLLEHLSSHADDPSNIYLGTSLPISSYPVLTPLTSLTSYLLPSSAAKYPEQYNSFIFQKRDATPVSLIRVYLSNGNFKTIDPMGDSTVEEVCHKMAELLKMKGNERGAIWIMKTITDPEYYCGEHFRRQLRLMEVSLSTFTS